LDTQRITQNFNSGQLPDKQLQAGAVLVNRYAIQEVIGIGGMGSVYRARDLHFPNVVKLVAVKEMINQARDQLVRQTIVQNFEREANILVTLEHPSIPRIFDYFTFNERSYLVIEFVNGKDLEEILSERQSFFPEEQVIKWAIELCDVLTYLHNHKPEPIIFRDMKPSNIMVNPNNRIVLIDFGIAKNFRGGQKGTMIGTEGYSPPEQYRGEATPQADIYALGATLHHLLTNKDPRLEPPFTFPDRPIRKINPAVSAELETVISVALQYNSADRFQSAEAMKEALITAGKKTGILSRVSSTPSVSASTNDGPKPLWTFRCEDEIRATPAIENGTLYVGAYDHNLYALKATDGQFLWKYATEAGIVSRPAVCDGQVVFGSEDGRLYSVSTASGKLAWYYPTEGPIRTSPAISEGHILFGGDDGFLYMLQSMSNRMIWRFEAGAPIQSSPVVAVDQVFFGSSAGDFFCLSITGKVKWRAKAKRKILSTPLVMKGTVFFTSVDSHLYAQDAKSGWSVWRFRMGKASASSPCGADNFVIVGSADGYIYCIDAGNAREVWRFQAAHQVSGSPIVYKDSVYCGDAEGIIYCLEYRTGRLRWKFKTGGMITNSPIVYNDVLYVGSADHILYALLA
jgi:eukaryotic-like serine/threonine-protein kinase